jgi:hypothetical protein
VWPVVLFHHVDGLLCPAESHRFLLSVLVFISFCFLSAKTLQRTNQQINNTLQQVGMASL